MITGGYRFSQKSDKICRQISNFFPGFSRKSVVSVALFPTGILLADEIIEESHGSEEHRGPEKNLGGHPKLIG